MTYEERQEENRREHNRWLDQQQHRRQDEQWNQKRLEGDRAEASRHFRQGNQYLGIYRLAGPAAANAYAERMREHQVAAASKAAEYWNRAITKTEAGDYTGAIDDLNVVLTFEPRHLVAHFERGNCYYRLGRYAEAERDYSEAITLVPSAFAYMQRGICRVAIENFDGAINDLSRAESLLPGERWDVFPQPDSAFRDDLTLIAYWRGRANQRLNGHKEAIEDFTAALNLNPTADGFRGRAQSWRAIGDYAGAVRDLDQAIRLDSTPDDYTQRGWVHFILGNDGSALSDFDTAIARGDESTFVYFGRGRVQGNMGNVAEALENYDTVIQLDPDHFGAYRHRGRLRFDFGEYETALADFDEDVRINPAAPRSYMARGDCHSKLRHRKAARQDFRRAADLYREQNMPQEAEEALKRAI